VKPPLVHPYVLAGGNSSRMGRDKALLPYNGKTLLEVVHGRLASLFGAATVVGPPERYASLNLPIIPDLHPGCGPLSGIEAALTHCETEWALVVACDMPTLRNEMLIEIARMAGSEQIAKIVMPQSPDGRAEPLCAAYHRSILPIIRKSLKKHVYKVTDAIRDIPQNTPKSPIFSDFSNLNTPADWEAFRG